VKAITYGRKKRSFCSGNLKGRDLAGSCDLKAAACEVVDRNHEAQGGVKWWAHVSDSTSHGKVDNDKMRG
jgi:hypothetical protein